MFSSILKTMNISLPDIVEKQIKRIFLAKAEQQNCDPKYLRFLLTWQDGNIVIYPINEKNKYLPVLTKKEIEEILV